MTFYRRPRVFLSYRHQERPPGLMGDDYNRQHRDWVERFANALATWNIDVIWDGRLRDFFRPHTSVDPEKLEFLAEISTLCFQAAQVFAPIVTAGYLERICGGAKGIVTEEWERAVGELRSRRLDIVPIIREWPSEAMPPTDMSSEKAWDYRFVDPDRDEVELLADSLHLDWDVERPPIDESFRDLISGYLKFCVDAYLLPWPGVERWGCDLDRVRAYVDFMRQMSEIKGSSSAGRSRDAREAGFGNLNVDDPEDEKFRQQAEDMLRASVRKVIGKRRGFDFAQAKAGSDGLHFGPTIPGFSYR